MSTTPGAVSPLVLAARAPAERLGVQVVHQLVELIVTGEVAQGAVLPPESVLCDQFGVSRTIIRESMKRLVEKGLVTIAQGRGTQVTPSTSWNLLDPVVLDALVEHDDSLGVLDDLAIVRAALEGAMAAATASHRRPGDLVRLDEAIQRMKDTISDEEAFSESDAEFHSVVMGLSSNLLAENITKRLYGRARNSSRFTAGNSPAAFRKTLEEHQRIAAAIVAGDPVAAEQAMRAHIEDAWRRRRLPTRRTR